MDRAKKIESSADIDKAIYKWRWFLLGVAALLIAAYMIYFWAILKQPASIKAETWGQFGDFLGGLLNPLVAFAAFYWLTQSVKIQKTELSESRKALNDSADAQREQARLSEKNTRIAALTAMVNSLQQQELILQGHISRRLLDNETLQAEIEELILYSKKVPTGKYGLDPSEAQEVDEKIKSKKSHSAKKLGNAGELSLTLMTLKLERNGYLDELRLLLKCSEAPAKVG